MSAAHVTVLVVDVVGVPAPQGSKRWVGGHRMVESSRAVAPWRTDVTAAALAAMAGVRWATLDGPVSVAVDFFLRRPASAPKRRLRPDRQPDLDKLLRSTLDALTLAQAFTDDARVVDIRAGKFFAGDGVPTGARIVVSAALGTSAATSNSDAVSL